MQLVESRRRRRASLRVVTVLDNPNSGAKPRLPVTQASCSPVFTCSSLFVMGRVDMTANRWAASNAIIASATPPTAAVLPVPLPIIPLVVAAPMTFEPTTETTTEAVVAAMADTRNEVVIVVATVMLTMSPRSMGSTSQADKATIAEPVSNPLRGNSGAPGRCGGCGGFRGGRGGWSGGRGAEGGSGGGEGGEGSKGGEGGSTGGGVIGGILS